MRTKTVKRYYCDFCSRGFFKKPDAINHELTCISNPKRACYLCGAKSGVFDFVGLANEMKTRTDVFCYEEENGYYSTRSKEAINWLYNKVDGCPTCVLAVLKMGKILAFDYFDYKEAKAEWYREENENIGINL
jgi:hypothetical protein